MGKFSEILKILDEEVISETKMYSLAKYPDTSEFLQDQFERDAYDRARMLMVHPEFKFIIETREKIMNYINKTPKEKIPDEVYDALVKINYIIGLFVEPEEDEEDEFIKPKQKQEKLKSNLKKSVETIKNLIKPFEKKLK